MFLKAHAWILSDIGAKDKIIKWESFNNQAEHTHPVLTDKSFYLWPATRTAQTLEPGQHICRSQGSYTVRLQVYKNPKTQAGGLVFRERGRLSSSCGSPSCGEPSFASCCSWARTHSPVSTLLL